MCKREHGEPAALATRAEHAPVAHGTRGKVRQLGGQRESDPSAPPRVGSAGGACTHADEAFGSSHARGEEQKRHAMDAAGRSPAIGTGRSLTLEPQQPSPWCCVHSAWAACGNESASWSTFFALPVVVQVHDGSLRVARVRPSPASPTARSPAARSR
jgi:hypothetical protein